jgi:hypothetical protein
MVWITQRITEGQNSGIKDNTVILVLNKSTSEMKFNKVFTACKDFGLNANFDKYIQLYSILIYLHANLTA